MVAIVFTGFIGGVIMETVLIMEQRGSISGVNGGMNNSGNGDMRN